MKRTKRNDFSGLKITSDGHSCNGEMYYVVILCYRKKEEIFHMNMILEKKNRGYGSSMFGVEYLEILRHPLFDFKEGNS